MQYWMDTRGMRSLVGAARHSACRVLATTAGRGARISGGSVSARIVAEKADSIPALAAGGSAASARVSP